MRLNLCILLVLASCGSDNSGLVFEGETGVPTATQLVAGVPAVDVAFASAENRPVLLDTGAPVTLLSQQAFSEYPPGETATGRLEGFGLVFPSFSVSMVDLFGETSPCDDPTPTGLLGMDLLGEFRVDLDYREGKAALFDGGDEGDELGRDTGPSEEVLFELVGGGRISAGESTRHVGPTRMLLEVIVEGQRRTALVDTGSSMTLISQDLFAQLSQKERPTLCCQGVFVASTGTQTAQLTRLRRLRVADTEFTNTPAMVLSDDALFGSLSREIGIAVQMVLGGSLLRLFASSIDFPLRSWRLRPYRKLDHVPEHEYRLPGFTFCKARDAGKGIVVLNVFQGSDAEAKGVRSGELVLSIDGQDLTQLKEREIIDLLGKKADGQVVSLDFRALDGGTVSRDVKVEELLPKF